MLLILTIYLQLYEGLEVNGIAVSKEETLVMGAVILVETYLLNSYHFFTAVLRSWG